MGDTISILIYLVVVLMLWWALQNTIKNLDLAFGHTEHGEPHGHGGAAATRADDLTKIEGIGPKISKILGDHDITTFAALAATEEARLEEILEAAGSRFRLAEPETWPEQAELAAADKWDELAALQERLTGGRE